MARLEWTVDYDAGIERGVVYSADGYATPWNGLVSVQESPSDLRTIFTYRDGIKIANVRSEDAYAAAIECLSYPEELSGGREVGFTYRTGSLIHIVYNARATMGDRDFTYGEPTAFSFDISTRPMPIPGARPGAHLVVDTEKAWLQTVGTLENILYGTEGDVPRLPSPSEVIEIFESNSLLRVIDHGDGSFTVIAPDAVINMIDDTTFEITWPSAIFIGTDEYKISSF